MNFTHDEKQSLAKAIDSNVSKAHTDARTNRGWDNAFKITAALIAVAIVIFSALASSDFMTERRQIFSLVSAILGGISGIVTLVGFTQYNFEKRLNIHATKVFALQGLRQELLYLDPDKKAFMDRLLEVQSWDDFNPPRKLEAPKPATVDPTAQPKDNSQVLTQTPTMPMADR